MLSKASQNFSKALFNMAKAQKSSMASVGTTVKVPEAQYVPTDDKTSQLHPSTYMVNKGDFSKLRQGVEKVLDDGYLFRYQVKTAEQSPVAQTEKHFSDTFGFKYVLAQNSCSSSIQTGLQAMGLQEGDRVLLPAFTFVAVPSAIIHAGGKPTLVEVSSNYSICLEDLEKKLIETKAKYLVLSYMRGHVPDMDKLMELVKKYNVRMLEDTAHALGVEWKGKQVGKFGECCAFSFQSNKIVDGGEGGVLCSNNSEIIVIANYLTGCYEYNINKHFDINVDKAFVAKHLGAHPQYNMRMNNLTAAIIKPQFELVEGRCTHHNEIYKQFEMYLNKSHMELPVISEHTRPALDSVQFRLKHLNDDQIRKFIKILEAQGVPIQVFGFVEYNARAFWTWRFLEEDQKDINNLPKTYEYIRTAADLRLPHTITEDQAYDMIMRCNKALADVL